MQNNGLFATYDENDSQEIDVSNDDKYLLFSSGGLLFGVKAEYVVEIITNFSVRQVPLLPDYVAGIINLRGQIIPLIDVRKFLNQELSQKCCVIIISVDENLVGAIVDDVEKMIDIPVNSIQPLRTGREDTNLSSGMYNIAEDKTMIEFDVIQLLQQA